MQCSTTAAVAAASDASCARFVAGLRSATSNGNSRALASGRRRRRALRPPGVASDASLHVKSSLLPSPPLEPSPPVPPSNPPRLAPPSLSAPNPSASSSCAPPALLLHSHTAPSTPWSRTRASRRARSAVREASAEVQSPPPPSWRWSARRRQGATVCDRAAWEARLVVEAKEPLRLRAVMVVEAAVVAVGRRRAFCEWGGGEDFGPRDRPRPRSRHALRSSLPRHARGRRRWGTLQGLAPGWWGWVGVGG